MDLIAKLLVKLPDLFLWRRIDAYRAENRHARILRERAHELPWARGSAYTTESAEAVALLGAVRDRAPRAR
jgi:hypothetical protein